MICRDVNISSSHSMLQLFEDMLDMILLYQRVRVLDDWMVHGLPQSWIVIWTGLEL